MFGKAAAGDDLDAIWKVGKSVAWIWTLLRSCWVDSGVPQLHSSRQLKWGNGGSSEIVNTCEWVTEWNSKGLGASKTCAWRQRRQNSPFIHLRQRTRERDIENKGKKNFFFKKTLQMQKDIKELTRNLVIVQRTEFFIWLTILGTVHVYIRNIFKILTDEQASHRS